MSTLVTLPTADLYDLRRSLSVFSTGQRDPTVRIDGDQIRFSLLTPEGSVVAGAVHSENRIRVELAGRGSRWLTPQLPALFGLKDNLAEFQPTGPLARLVKRRPGIHLSRQPVIFHRLIRIVLHQLVTWEEAAHGWSVMTHRYGEQSPDDPELLVGPTPARLKNLAYYDLVDCGILPRQARLILTLAADHRRIELAREKGDPTLIKYLSRIPGIGAWTIATLRGSCLGDPDSVVTGDYGLPHIVCWFFERQERGSDEEMLKLLEPSRGHRYRVQNLLMHSGVQPPRRGPKMAIRTWK